jgi:ComEC/Rec2-related protein
MDWLERRPLAVISASFVVGALAEAALPEKPFTDVASLLLGVFSLVCAAFTARQRLLWMALFSLALGFSVTRFRLPSMPQNLEPPFEGIVATSPLPISNGYRLILQVGDAFAQLTVNSDNSPRWQIGDLVSVKDCWVRLTDWRRYRFQRIFWVGQTNGEAIERLGNEKDAFALSRWRERWRKFVFERWQKSMPERERTFTISSLASIVFGMRTAAISEADERAFARSGLAHLFVPSGSQVTLLMGLAWLGNRVFNLPPFPLLTLLLGFYLPLTRGEPSIYRAVLMGIYAFVGWRWWRDVDWQTSLWLSSAVLVAIAPEMLHDAGFQLSYAATFGLIYASPLLLRFLHWLPEWLRFPVAATLSAQIFLTPILAHYFGRISLIAPLANFCAVIPASFALTLGFVSALLSTISPSLAMPVSFVAGELAKLVVLMAHWFAAPSWASIYVRRLSGWETLLVLALLTALVAWMKRAIKVDYQPNAS